MAQISSAAPRAVLQGIQDNSIRPMPPVTLQLPSHLPHIPVFAERGPMTPQYVGGSSAITTYGANTFDYTQPYANHSTVLANTVNANGNLMLMQRVCGVGATAAMSRLSVELTAIAATVTATSAGGTLIGTALPLTGTPTITISGATAVPSTGIVMVEVSKSDPYMPDPISGLPATESRYVALTYTSATPGTNTIILGGITGGSGTISGTNAFIATATLPSYQRVATTGQWSLSTGGAKQQNATNTVPGIIRIWHLNQITSTNNTLGGAAASTSSVYVTTTNGLVTVSRTGTGTAIPTIILPIFDWEVASVGAYGNRTGLRLYAPNALSSAPPDIAEMGRTAQYLYRFQMVERPTGQITPMVTTTLTGATSLDLAIQPNVLDPLYNNYISANMEFAQAYQDDEPITGPDIIGPISQFYTYDTNVTTVLNMLFAIERNALETSGYFSSSVNPSPTIAWNPLDPNTSWVPIDYDNAANVGLMNILSSSDFNGVPYEGIAGAIVSGDTDNVTFDSNVIGTMYAVGGSDGELDTGSFDTAVYNLFTNYNNYVDPITGVLIPLMDDAKYQQSVVYDSGYSVQTKGALLNAIGFRKDIAVILGTHATGSWSTGVGSTWSASTIQLTESLEEAALTLLSTKAALFPESELYGTPVCRAAIIGHSGYLINSQYVSLLPLTIEIADKMSKYMGAGTGIWNAAYAPDVYPGNRVNLFKKVNLTWKTSQAYATDWGSGLVWVQNYDPNSLFIPALKTVYQNDTSVLNSIITMFGCVELEKVAQRTWRDLTGDTSLNDGQFIKKSNQLITDRVANRFNNRFVIVPNTFKTQDDVTRGYSWSTIITIYANNMRTVGSFTIAANRMSDLATTNTQ